MEREKFLNEHKDTLESLIEKVRFVYSQEYYNLDEFEKQKYNKDKMATEAHLGTLSNVLWGKTPQINGMSDMFLLGLMGAMFNGGGWGNTSTTSAGMLNANEEITPIKDDNEV